MDLYIDKEGTKDLVFVNGSCPVTEDFVESVAQRLFVMLRTFEDEWFLNITTGVPYYNILGTKLDKSKIDSIIQRKILNEEGVSEIISYFSSLEGDRVYEANFRVRAVSGGEIEQSFTLGE